MISWLSFACLVLATRQLTDIYFSASALDLNWRHPELGWKPFNCCYCMNLWFGLALAAGLATQLQLPFIVGLVLWLSTAHLSWILDGLLPLHLRWSRPVLVVTPQNDTPDTVFTEKGAPDDFHGHTSPATGYSADITG